LNTLFSGTIYHSVLRLSERRNQRMVPTATWVGTSSFSCSPVEPLTEIISHLGIKTAN